MDARKIAALVAASVIGFGAGAGITAGTEEGAPPSKLKTRVVVVPTCKTGEVNTPDGKCLPVGTPPETAVAQGEALKLREPKVGTPFQSTSPIQVSTHGVQFVADFEGFSSCPYWDPYGRVATRGYGETDFNDTFGGRCISQSFAIGNLRRLLNNNYVYPIRQIGGNFTQNQIDAMASASYNLGPGIIFKLASSFRAHNCTPLLAYDHAGGQRLEGLTRRRRAECALFYNGHQPTPPHVETQAERVARYHRELKAHERLLRSLERRHALLHRELQARGCRARLHFHRPLGPTCRRWFHEGDVTSTRARGQIGIIRAFHHKGIF